MFSETLNKKEPKKQVKYMKSNEIEGQEWTETVDFDEKGIKIEPFNMDQELEDGGFDENGANLKFILFFIEFYGSYESFDVNNFLKLFNFLFIRALYS